jgi:hypothetical protein
LIWANTWNNGICAVQKLVCAADEEMMDFEVLYFDGLHIEKLTVNYDTSAFILGVKSGLSGGGSDAHKLKD